MAELIVLRARLLVAFAALWLATAPAHADTTIYTLSGSWQKIATAGTSVEVFDASGSVILSSAGGGPGGAPTAQTGIGLLPGQDRCFTLTADLWALSSQGQVNVITGFNCPGVGSGGGGGSVSGTVTANQGSAASTPWSSTLYQGGSALSATNPIFAQLTAGAAQLGYTSLSIGGVAVAYGQATMANSIPVVIASDYVPALAPLAAKDGTDASAATPPSGATGIRGWLSGLYTAVSGALTVTPFRGTITQTETPVPATTSTAITTLSSRKFLRMTNDGTAPCRVSYGAAATASNGEPVAAAGATNGQGGAVSFDAGFVPQATVYAYCTAASSFAVVEGQ